MLFVVSLNLMLCFVIVASVELFANGTNLHICIQKYLEGEKEIDVKEPNQGHWKSLQPIFRDIFDVVCTEEPVKHSALRYKGILDCVANYRYSYFLDPSVHCLEA